MKRARRSTAKSGADLYPEHGQIIAEDPCGADLLWDRAWLGGLLRQIRYDRGFSIADLERASNIGHSEIHKIETGQQECRIETLVRLSGALGVSPGWVLDRALRSNVSLFYWALKNDPALKDFVAMATLAQRDFDFSARFLANICTFAALLTRCSDPVSRVKDTTFPHPYWEKAFSRFAQKLVSMFDGADKAAISRELLLHPIAEMRRQGVLDLADGDFSTAFDVETKYRGWTPWIYSQPVRARRAF